MKLIALLTSFFFAGTFAIAQTSVWNHTYTWTGNGNTTNWNSASNWQRSGNAPSGSTPTPCSKVIIPDGRSLYPNINSTVSLRELSFTGTTATDGITLGTSGNVNFTSPTDPKFSNVLDDDDILMNVTPGTTTTTRINVQKDLSNANYALSKYYNTCATIYRFEVKDGDYWQGDVGNTQNGGKIKERSELKVFSDPSRPVNENRGVLVPFNTDLWFSYSMFIEDGPDIDYTRLVDGKWEINEDFTCNIGQWHQHPGGDAPPFSLTLNGQGDMALRAFKPSENPTDAFKVKKWVVSRGEWHTFVIKVRFGKGSTPNTSITIWIDDDTEANPTVNETQLDHHYTSSDYAGYWKWGIYRTPFSDSKPDTPLAVRYANMELDFDGVGSNLSSRIASPLPVD